MELLFTNIFIAACLIWIIVTGIFFFAQLLDDNSIIDIFYGPIFFVVAFLLLIITNTTTLLSTIITICIALWATRLGGRLLIKNFGEPEDSRYAKWREQWMQKGRLYFLVRSYLQINLLQGFIILLILLPFLVSTASSEFSTPFVVAGVAVFLFGLIWESLADYQLDRFIAKKKARETDEKLMTSGVFKYSRRPNYFGETLIWWGQAIMVASLPLGWLALIGPVVITLVLVRISGPMIEKQFLEKYPEEYKNYMATTSFMIPKKPRTLPDAA